ncbi:hypothetical protein O3P69_005101 [Scylla paramamosain]|uniref:Uncharacterized protein n=1 Tax=Scylla paramamosain TaxID=85552 RepID=A0AAW0UF79_SCYPA
MGEPPCSLIHARSSSFAQTSLLVSEGALILSRPSAHSRTASHDVATAQCLQQTLQRRRCEKSARVSSRASEPVSESAVRRRGYLRAEEHDQTSLKRKFVR